MRDWDDLSFDVRSKMLGEQERQGNKRDASVFKRNLVASASEGGFDWYSSEDGVDFWEDVVSSNGVGSQYKVYTTKKPSFGDIANGIAEMLEIKDKAYGNAALKPLDIFAKHHAYGARLDEKLARVKNGDELRKNDVADIIGGLMLICKDREWFDFKDLID